MKNQTKYFLLTFILLLTFSITAFADNAFHNISGAVYFSPNGGCLDGRSARYGLAKGDTVFKVIFIKPLIALNGKFSDMRHHCRAAKSCPT